jgi:hypothetical protein
VYYRGRVERVHRELHDLGYVEGVPRVLGVQSEGTSAIHDAFHGHDDAEAAAETVADSIAVGRLRNTVKACRALEESSGTPVHVPDAEILEAEALLGRTEGIYTEPAVAGVRRALAEGVIDPDETVVVAVTGFGLKDPESARRAAGDTVDIPPETESVRNRYDTEEGSETGSTDDRHGDGCLADDSRSDGSEEPPGEFVPLAAVAPHDDEVDVARLHELDDGLGGVARLDRGLDRAVGPRGPLARPIDDRLGALCRVLDPPLVGLEYPPLTHRPVERRHDVQHRHPAVERLEGVGERLVRQRRSVERNEDMRGCHTGVRRSGHKYLARSHSRVSPAHPSASRLPSGGAKRTSVSRSSSTSVNR